MNLDLILAIIFYGFLLLIFLKYRNKFEIQGKILALYKTKLGLNLMEKISKFWPGFLKITGYLGILIGISGMLFIFYFLIKGSYNLLLTPTAQPVLAPVLPGIKIAGLPRLSFWHWIISILVVAIVHEFSHGVFSRLYDVKIKSSGFAFLGPILAAFVEPDEKVLVKKSKLKQLSIFSAGPFANIILAGIILVITVFLINPAIASLTEIKGIQIVNVNESSPAATAGIQKDEVILKINNISMDSRENIDKIFNELKPNQTVYIETNKTVYSLITKRHYENLTRGYLGISIAPYIDIKSEIKTKYWDFSSVLFWIIRLFLWLYVINLGVGLFNLLPLGPVDGGRMFYIITLFFTRNNKKISNKIFIFITLFCIFLIFINLLPYLTKLVSFIFNFFLL